MATTPVSFWIANKASESSTLSDRDLDQHMFACTHHLLSLLAMQRRRGGENHPVAPFDTLAEVAGMMRDCILLGDFRGSPLIATHQAGDFYAGYALKGVEVLLTEGALACNADLHRTPRRCAGRPAAATRLFFADVAGRVFTKSIRFWAGGRPLSRPGHYDLGYFDLEQKTLQPLDNPFGTRLSPMS
jgi:hypothetical protein